MMESSNKKTCLLIGNGLNRINNNSIKWDDLIKLPIEHYGCQGYVDIPRMSYPLKFEYIVNFINENKNPGKGTESLYREIKQLIIDKLNSETEGKMLDKDIRDLLLDIKPSSIITTNYDTQLEKVFASKGKYYKYNDTLIKKMNSSAHPEQELVLTKTATLRNVDFYHMHGINVAPRTVCLGYEHYVRIIAKLRERMGCDRKHNKLISTLKGAYHKSVNPTYLVRFFDSNVFIIGLGLNEDEIDLWWILCYRAYLYFSNIEDSRPFINNMIVYYDIHSGKVTSDGYSYEDDYLAQKKALFKYLNIEYKEVIVENNDYKSAYIKALNDIREVSK